jgi:(p)ppGpp synthase/HD superfamily hydrolase
MKNWNQDNYVKAWNYASYAHKGQFLPGQKIPYINHIGLVTMEAMSAITNSNINAPDLLITIALLHDTIEDTETTYGDIQNDFGLDVANGVLALSKNLELSSKQEQMKDSLERIKNEPAEIWMVKLCDRITNLQPPPKYWTKEKVAAYRKEAFLILQELGSSNDYLAERLKLKIEQYQCYE